MSGGSMDNLYYKVQYAEFVANTPERRAFRSHLDKVADALKAIEWRDSGDGARDEEELIAACLSDGAILAQVLIDAREAVAELERRIREVKS